MKVEVMVPSAQCADLRRKLDRMVETEPAVIEPKELAGTTVLVYDITKNDGRFAQVAMNSGASSVRSVEGLDA